MKDSQWFVAWPGLYSRERKIKPRTKKITAKKSSLLKVSDRNEVSHGKNVEIMQTHCQTRFCYVNLLHFRL